MINFTCINRYHDMLLNSTNNIECTEIMYTGNKCDWTQSSLHTIAIATRYHKYSHLCLCMGLLKLYFYWVGLCDVRQKVLKSYYWDITHKHKFLCYLFLYEIIMDGSISAFSMIHHFWEVRLIMTAFRKREYYSYCCHTNNWYQFSHNQFKNTNFLSKH